MINIFSFDIDKYDLGEVRAMYHEIQKILPDGDVLIALPKHCDFYHDVSIDMLYYYRQMFDDLIQERQRRNATKDDL